METEIHEQYEYARRRIRQKKNLYLHFVLFLLGSSFMFIANHFMDVKPEINWSIWAVTFWFFLLILHFIKVYITDRFMNKNWERAQVERLVALQQKRIAQLEQDLEQNPDTQN